MSFDNLYAKYPGLKPVDQALEEYFAHKPVTAKCYKCGKVLMVDYVVLPTGTTTTWVNCETGCTAYHSLGELQDKDSK